MAAKVVYTVREDKQGLQKQLGCMNGIFHILDRGYLLGLHRNWRSQNRLTAGQGEKELKKSSEKVKERNQKKMIIEKNRASVESSRNSCSSSCSSTTFSSFDCSKNVQTEWQLPSEPTSPNLHKKQPEPDIRDVVRDSMSRVIRVTTKDERAGPVMKHVDSPRPFTHQNPIQYDRKDRNLANVQKLSSGVKKVNEISRFSCDERESKNSLKSTFKVNKLPRLSLDSKRSSKPNLMNESRSEPGSNKRPSSGIVARLMGLDSLTDPICKVETLKVKSAFGDQLGSRSPKVHSKIKPALQQQEVREQGSKKPSVYCEMEKPGSPTVKGPSSPKKRELLNRAAKPAKMAIEPVMVTGQHYVNHKARKQVKDPTNNKVTGTTPRSLQDLTAERPVTSPRLQRSKFGIDKQCVNGPSSDSSRAKKESNLKTTHAKIKPVKTESKQEATRNKFAERLIDKPMVELTMDQASPVSVLDAFYVEDIPSPVKNKPNAFTDFDNFRADETEWNQVGICNLATRTDAGEFHQSELLNSTDDDHKYIRDILLASGLLKDPDSAIRIAQLHSAGSILRPGLFHILEKTNVECHKNNPSSKSNEKVRRKLIFDSVNDILFQKLVMSDFSGKRCTSFVDREKLLTELWSEIDNLQGSSERCVYDEDDGIKNLVSADFNKSSQDWDKYCYEVPGIVLDIERLIFKDLVDEIVNADATHVQNRVGRRCRQLFSL